MHLITICSVGYSVSNISITAPKNDKLKKGISPFWKFSPKIRAAEIKYM